MPDDLHRALQLLAIVPVVFASLVLHEVAHGRAALALGDDSAQRQGRLSLNPMRHLDPVGLAVFVVCLLVLHVGFGWAKPVPIDPRKLQDPKRDMARIAIAGPAMNFVLAGLAAGTLLLLSLLGIVDVPRLLDIIATSQDLPVMQSWQMLLGFVLLVGVTANLVLGLLNLLPIPPLDGSRILYAMLPYYWGYRLYRLQSYTIPALLAIPALLILYNLYRLLAL